MKLVTTKSSLGAAFGSSATLPWYAERRDLLSSSDNCLPGGVSLRPVTESEVAVEQKEPSKPVTTFFPEAKVCP